MVSAPLTGINFNLLFYAESLSPIRVSVPSRG